jgi:hypothetical protein
VRIISLAAPARRPSQLCLLARVSRAFYRLASRELYRRIEVKPGRVSRYMPGARSWGVSTRSLVVCILLTMFGNATDPEKDAITGTRG